MENQHIALQSFDLFDRIERIHRHPTASPENIRAKYILLYKVLEEAAYELTAQSTLTFANLFSRLDYIGKEKKMTPSDRYAIQTMRRNCNKATGDRFQADMQEYLYDLRALVRFVSLGFEEDIPAQLLPEIPHSNRPYPGTRLSQVPYLRAYVTSWNDSLIFASCDSEEEPFIVINYEKAGYNGDQLYIRELLKENLPLNLLDVKVDENNHYIPKLIVAYPDYLIDVSSLSRCFREYGHHPFNYFMDKIQPKANISPILMGNLASQLLDDFINEMPDAPVNYAKAIRKFFSESALELCTCELPANFHAAAQSQMMNIRSFIQNIFPRNISGFDRQKTLLEASFICEQLGLQGRVDMLQKDFKILVEQKAGKRDEYHNNRHKEDHFIQMMLYQGVLMYNFGRQAKDMQTFLLYSKYADGLMLEHFSENLFRESIRLRNRIAAQEVDLAEGCVRKIIDSLNTDLLNEQQTDSKLWVGFQEPQLQTSINRLKRCTPLERAYFDRFFTFVSKEMLLNKTGGNEDPSRGFAATWHNPVKEKQEAGNILTGLILTDKRKSGPNKGYDLIELRIPEQDDDFLPNFRTGDIVLFYAYKEKPDVRNQILMKGNIVSIESDRLTLQLRNGQQNKDIIGSPEETFCIEHDSSDTSSANAIKGLFQFLNATEHRKQLLLCQCAPAGDSTRKLNGSYGRFDELVLREKQADDYFLLVGPPGTGKTSCALRYMVEEALTEPDISILLLSYTNRAVDEICSMLAESGISEKHSFIRVGHELSCDKRFRPFLLKNALADCSKLNDIKQRISKTRIFVGTTTAFSSRPYFFNIKHFEIAFIDEASQILEPDLIGILSARQGTRNAIDKFVLIGDYKQLPAISQQNEKEAAVTDRLLLDIGLSDCRNSLFERLYHQCPPTFRGILHKQGRMHPAISDFPNHAFYYHEQLEPVPLPHQDEEFPYPQPVKIHDTVDWLLMNRRMIFIPADAPEDSATISDKTNIHEARIVALLLKHIYQLTADSFNPDKTVGVIVPYRNQIAMIRKEISRLNIPELADISIDTVERYQGSQRDVIIYSFTVRNFSQLNFLTSNTFAEDGQLIDRKLNVAITRARKQLILTGNPQILGANITFYKLMEYIRMHNGYIDISVSAFLGGNFQIPEYEQHWDLLDAAYELPEELNMLYMELTGNITESDMTDTAYRELTSYGRTDFRNISEEKMKQCVITYNRYYMRKQYMGARAAFENCGNWLRKTIRKVAGRVVFCDFSFESGSSAVAFAEMCRDIPHCCLHILGLYPVTELANTAEHLLTKLYPNIQCSFSPRLSSVKREFWTAHSVLPELIVFHFGNVFDRIPAEEARDLALQINQLIYARPFNLYAVFFRDDAGQCANIHPYRVFCKYLTKDLIPLSRGMPFSGKLYHPQNKGLRLPAFEEFLYELRTNAQE